jgi:hypothetical protein
MSEEISEVNMKHEINKHEANMKINMKINKHVNIRKRKERKDHIKNDEMERSHDEMERCKYKIEYKGITHF